MYCNEDCGLHHSLEWQKLAPASNGTRTLNATNTNPQLNWIPGLSSAVPYLGVQEKKFPLLDLEVDPSALWSMAHQ
jgi:hypothetical protein